MTDFYARINDAQFDHIISISEKNERQDAVRSNEAFAAAMAREIKRGKIKVRPGTFVDHSPTNARRIRGDVEISACGSPAAMCAESGFPGGGAETLK